MGILRDASSSLPTGRCVRAGGGRQSAVPTGSPACHSERPKGLASRRSEESVPPAARGKK